MKVQLLCVEIWAFFVTVLTYELEFLDLERNLNTLAKVNLQSASK